MPHPYPAFFIDLELLKVILPITIAVVGWVVTHVLSLRAQRKTFQNQVLDRARVDVTTKLREYQSWLGQLSTWMRTIDFSKAALLAGITPNFQQKADELLAISQRRTNAWSVTLEDYQILFPETALARFRISRRHLQILRQIGDPYSELLRLSLGHPTAQEIDKVFQAAKQPLALVEEQAALLEDLRVHLQNVALSESMDRTIPMRSPPDKTVPRLVMNSEGLLEVVDGFGTPLDDGGATPEELAAKILADRSK